MAFRQKRDPSRGKRSLARLAADTGGNVLAIMAMSLIPLSALAGSAVDMSRLYVVKVRLQQACDAGALAGRKFMTVDNFDNDVEAKKQAKAFFDNNFRGGWFRTASVAFTPRGTADGQVEGDASAVVPMSVMHMFGQPDQRLEVTCEARLEIADVDVTFVLDTTGSMACTPQEENCNTGNPISYTREDGSQDFARIEQAGSRMDGLRAAVLNFYDTLENAADPTTRVRYAFVPYASSVNVGRVLRNRDPSFLLSDNHRYLSRQHIGDANDGSSTEQSGSGLTKAQCDAYAGRSPVYPNYNTDSDGFSTATKVTVAWTPASAGASTGRCVGTIQRVIPQYNHGFKTWDISGYVRGNAVRNPAKVTNETTRWKGCIEEREQLDLDIVTAPSSRETRWRPAWPEVIYRRNPNNTADEVETYNDRGLLDDTGPNTSWYRWVGGPRLTRQGNTMCPKEVTRLAELDRNGVETYLAENRGFRPQGGTYHDFGMIWGARIASPTGMFAADTAAWPNRNAPNRNIIFMTDGFIAPNTCSYGMMGVEAFDRRVLGGNLKGCGPNAALPTAHMARFSAACEAAKAQNVTVWVIAFSAGVTMTDELRDCATAGKAFQADDNDDLDREFKKIAAQIAELRLSK